MEKANVLVNYLKQNSSFNDDDIKLICSYFEVEELSKEDVLFQKGKHFRKIVFVAEGILRSFIHDENGEEIVKHFITDNDFFTELDSFENGEPCSFNVSAVINCTLFLLSKSNSIKLSQKVSDWENKMNAVAIKAMNSMIRKQEFLNVGEAIDKYRFFVRNFPQLAQQVPLKYIASYLRITQSSLSRIRRQV